jgi:folate-binding protein YgfZ
LTRLKVALHRFVESLAMTTHAPLELDAQYRQLREECGLLDRSNRGKLLLNGADAAEFLQGQLTNDIEALAPGEGCYAALLDRKGHVEADMRVLRLSAETIWVDTEVEVAALVLRHLEMYKIGRAVEVADVTTERAILSLIGPATPAISEAPVLDVDENEEAKSHGSECIAVGTPGGLDLIVEAAEANRLREALLAAGAAEVDPAAVEIVRIESGRPRFGAEIGIETMPAEAGIVESAVSFTKGCYIGQEPVARLHHRGRPNRHLRGLAPSAPVEPGATLRLGEKEVGVVASAAVSPALGPIALAIIRREAEPGAELAVGEDGVTAQVVDLPFS